MSTERSSGGIERTLDAPLLRFDIPKLVAQLKGERTWAIGTRNAITLLKTPALRIVLVAMRAETEVASHRGDGPISVQVLDGRIAFDTADQTLELGAGALVTLHAGIQHGLRALEECAYLLSIAGALPHPAE